MINLRQQLVDHCEHVYRLNMIACGHRLFPCLFCQILFLNVGNAHTYFVIKYPKYHCPPLSEKIRKTLGQKNTTKLCIYIYMCVQYLRMLWKTTPKEYQHAKIHVFSLVWGSMIQNHDLGCARGENLADFCTGKFPIPFHDLTHRIHGAGIYGAPWIPSIYPLYVSKYTSTMDPSWVMTQVGAL